MLEKLLRYGADVPAGLHRSMGNKTLYRSCLRLLAEDGPLGELSLAVSASRWNDALVIADSTAGAASNLGLTRLARAAETLTDVLHRREASGAAGAYAALLEEWELFRRAAGF